MVLLVVAILMNVRTMRHGASLLLKLQHSAQITSLQCFMLPFFPCYAFEGNTCPAYPSLLCPLLVLLFQHTSRPDPVP
jgi:hypothetical protein